MWLTIEEANLQRKLTIDMERLLPSIWSIIYGENANKHYQEYLINLRNETKSKPMVKKTS